MNSFVPVILAGCFRGSGTLVFYVFARVRYMLSRMGTLDIPLFGNVVIIFVFLSAERLRR